MLTNDDLDRYNFDFLVAPCVSGTALVLDLHPIIQMVLISKVHTLSLLCTWGKDTGANLSSLHANHTQLAILSRKSYWLKCILISAKESVCTLFLHIDTSDWANKSGWLWGSLDNHVPTVQWHHTSGTFLRMDHGFLPCSRTRVLVTGTKLREEVEHMVNRGSSGIQTLPLGE